MQLLSRVRGALSAPLPLLGLVAAVGPLAMANGSATAPITPAEAAYQALPALPAGSEDRGEEGVVETALALAATLNAVAVNDDGDVCPPELLYVSWTEPGDGYEHGAHVTPIGPAPTATTTQVNGVVL
ncbi:MAG TPA: hypothetical protein VD931_11655, partial [Baekduia sp.]|nr:hypothetical protein [Baekduia sp.]